MDRSLPADQLVPDPAIPDQVLDGDNLQPVQAGEVDQLRQAGHGPVLVHDLADHRGRAKSGVTRQVDGGLRVARPLEHAPLAGDQGEDVPGTPEILRPPSLLGEGPDRDGPVRGGDARGRAAAGVHADREGRAVEVRVRLHHGLQRETPGLLLLQGSADQPARVGHHEVDVLGTAELRRHDQIALVLPVVVVHDDHHPPPPDLLDRLVDRGEGGGPRCFPRHLGHDAPPRLRPGSRRGRPFARPRIRRAAPPPGAVSDPAQTQPCSARNPQPSPPGARSIPPSPQSRRRT